VLAEKKTSCWVSTHLSEWRPARGTAKQCEEELGCADASPSADHVRQQGTAAWQRAWGQLRTTFGCVVEMPGISLTFLVWSSGSCQKKKKQNKKPKNPAPRNH